MELTREYILRLQKNRQGTTGGGGGAAGTSGNYVTPSQLESALANKVDVSFFSRLFELYNGEGTTAAKIETNATLPEDTSKLNIKAPFDFWSQRSVSALGKGSGGSSSGFDEAAMWTALGGSIDNQQIALSHLTTALSGYVKGVKVNGTTYNPNASGIVDLGTITGRTYAFATGATNGTFKVTPSVGDAYEVAIKGLAALAYKASLTAADIPNIDATKITTGILGVDRIPGLSADKITSGTLSVDRIPDLSGKYVTTTFFNKLFRAQDASGNDITVNASTAVDSIKAMVGFWAEQYISALGKGDDSTDAVFDEAAMWSALGGSIDNKQIALRHLTTALSGYVKGVKVSGTIYSPNSSGIVDLGTIIGSTYAFATGATNGTFKVTPSVGDAYEVPIKGLGSLAYKASLTAGDIPNLDAAKITTGILSVDRIPDLSGKYVTTTFFNKLFRAQDASGNDITVNASTAVDSIKAMVGFWAEQYVSALGKGDDGTAAVFDEAAMWNALKAAGTANKIHNDHLNLGTLTIKDGNNATLGTWTPTVSGVITVSSGLDTTAGDKRYLKLDGSNTMTGDIVSTASGLVVRMDRDTSNAKTSLAWRNAAGDTLLGGIQFHNTANRLMLNATGVTAMHDDKVGNYTFIVGNNELKYNTYNVLHAGNSSVSKSGETLTVKINGAEQSITNTWRGIQDSLTSDSATDSLSAKQGKALKGLIDGNAGKIGTLQGYFTNGVANSAAKLSTVSKTAWGREYWTAGGVPTNISGDMTDVGVISFLDGTNGRKATIDRDGAISVTAPTSGGWAMMYGGRTKDNGTALGGFGFFGEGDALNYLYLGTAYNNAWMVVRPNGHVGIGTTQPVVTLDVNGHTRTNRLYLYKPNAENDTNAVYLVYDSNGGVHLVGAGFYADTFVSALGKNDAGTAAFDWSQLTSQGTELIHASHLANVTKTLTIKVNGTAVGEYNGTAAKIIDINSGNTYTFATGTENGKFKVTPSTGNAYEVAIKGLAALAYKASLTAGDIPNLDAAKITSGTFVVDRIPSLSASKITSGTFGADRIPGLAASKITSGTFDAARIPDLSGKYVTIETEQTVSGNKKFSGTITPTGGIVPRATGGVNTHNAADNSKLVVKQASAADDGTPNNGLVLEWGTSGNWVGQLYFGDNGTQGLYWGGWTYRNSVLTRNEWVKLAFVTDTVAAANKLTVNAGSATQPVYFSGGVPVATTYALGATLNSGTQNRLAYYSGTNEIKPTGNVSYLPNTPTGRLQNGFRIWGQTYGNSELLPISGTVGDLQYGDGGPQIQFSTVATDASNTQSGALIYTDNDCGGLYPGASFHFVTNQGANTWVVASRFHAKNSIKIGDITIVNENGGLHVVGGGLYADTYISALGKGDDGTAAVFDEVAMWQALGTNINAKKISQSYLNLTGYAKTSDLNAYVKGVKVNGTSYTTKDADGIVDLGEIKPDLSNYLPLSGGTMTGGLNFKFGHDLTQSNNGVTTTNWYGIRICDKNTYLSAQLLNQVQTDGTNALNFNLRNRNGSTEYDKSLMIYLTKSGVISASLGGKFTASSFVKSGGTSSQFLKADGSVDSNTYLTGISNGMITNAMLAGGIENGKLKNSSVTVNGTSVSLGGSITTTKWGTKRAITIADNSNTNTQANTGIDGSADFTLKLPSTIKASLTGNADTATTATKLSITSKTAWGQTYWTADGVPTNISGNMTGVGVISFLDGTNGRKATINCDASISVTAPTSGGGWAMMYSGRTKDNSTSLGGFGFLGNGDALNYLFLGTRFDDVWMVVKPTGYVGIGTNSPTQKLDVSGNIHLTGDIHLNNTKHVYFRNAANSGDVNVLALDGSNQLFVGGGMTGAATYIRGKQIYLQSGTSSTTALSINENGLVEIVQNTQGLKIGNAYLVWDSANNALKVTGTNSAAVNFYATGGVSALGMGDSGSGGGDYIPLSGSSNITGSLVPASTDNYNLGTQAKSWSNIYTSYLHTYRDFYLDGNDDSHIYANDLKIYSGYSLLFYCTERDNPITFGTSTYNQGILSYGGFKKSGSSDSYVLLGGGGDKALSDFVRVHSNQISGNIYSVPCGTIFSGIDIADAPTTGWVSGIALGSNLNSNHYQSYLVESNNGNWYVTRSYQDGAMTNWKTLLDSNNYMQYTSAISNSADASAGSLGWIRVAIIKVNSAWCSQQIFMRIVQRGGYDGDLKIYFNNQNTTDPTLNSLTYTGTLKAVKLIRYTAGTWYLYVQKSESWDAISVAVRDMTPFMQPKVTVTYDNVFSSSEPTGTDFSDGSSGNWYATPRWPFTDGDGRVGIGITNPSYTLHVNGSAYARTLTVNGMEISWDTSLGTYYFNTDNQDVQTEGTWRGTFVSGSDIRLKDIDRYLDGKLEDIARAPIFSFGWKDKKNKQLQLGTSAQYWQDILPFGVFADARGYLALDYGATALAAAVFTARKVVDHELRVKQLEERIAELENEIKELKAA